MIALGDDLSPKQNIDLTRPHAADEPSGCRRRTIQGIAGCSIWNRASGNIAVTSSAIRSTPGAARHETIFGPACGTGFWQSCAISAMVALQSAKQAMFNQPGGTARAFEAMAAGLAERERRVTGTIEENQRLFSRRKSPRDRSIRGRDIQRPVPVAPGAGLSIPLLAGSP